MATFLASDKFKRLIKPTCYAMGRLLLLVFVAMAVVCVSRATNQTENLGNISIVGNVRMHIIHIEITVLPQRQLNCTNFPTDSDIWLYQGDLLLTKDQRSAIEALSNPNDPYAPMYAFVKSENALWSNGILYYVLDDSLNGIHVYTFIS